MNQFLAALNKFIGKRTPGASACKTIGCGYEAPKGQDLCHACLNNKLLAENIIIGKQILEKLDNINILSASSLENFKVSKKISTKKFTPSINILSSSSNLEAKTSESGRNLDEIAKRLPK